MKRAILKAIEIIFISLFILLALFIIFVLYHSNIQTKKGDEAIGVYPSPDGAYIVTTYLNNGSMITDFAILGRVENTQTHRARNIYWNTIAMFPTFGGRMSTPWLLTMSHLT